MAAGQEEDVGHPPFKKIKRAHPENKRILDLDDACLLHIFSFLNPLPDLFNAARACTRLRDFVHTRRSWLVVCHDPAAPVVGIPQQYRHQFTTLHSAIAASRPGDTILLEPGGTATYTAANLLIAHPLHILGGGSSPDECTIHCTSPADSILSFAATGRISNITLRGGLGGCVVHYRGRLEIEDCILRCHAKGLRHLVSPLVSQATSRTTSQAPLVLSQHPLMLRYCTTDDGARELKKGGAKVVQTARCIDEAQRKFSYSRAPLSSQIPTLAFPGPGQLVVVGCGIQGGCTAVRLCGTGTLKSVRVIYEAHKALFWFEVDSIDSSEEDRIQGRKQGKEDKIAQHAQHEEGISSLLQGNKRKVKRDAASGSYQEVTSIGYVVPSLKRAADLNEVPSSIIEASNGAAPTGGMAAEDQGPSWIRQGAPGFDPGALQAQIAATLMNQHQ